MGKAAPAGKREPAKERGKELSREKEKKEKARGCGALLLFRFFVSVFCLCFYRLQTSFKARGIPGNGG